MLKKLKMPHLRPEIQTIEGKRKYAEIMLSISENVLSSTFLLLVGTSAISTMLGKDTTEFVALLWLSGIGALTGMYLLLRGINNYDESYREKTRSTQLARVRRDNQRALRRM
jgi:hypothetical protein